MSRRRRRARGRTAITSAASRARRARRCSSADGEARDPRLQPSNGPRRATRHAVPLWRRGASRDRSRPGPRTRRSTAIQRHRRRASAAGRPRSADFLVRRRRSVAARDQSRGPARRSTSSTATNPVFGDTSATAASMRAPERPLRPPTAASRASSMPTVTIDRCGRSTGRTGPPTDPAPGTRSRRRSDMHCVGAAQGDSRREARRVPTRRWSARATIHSEDADEWT